MRNRPINRRLIVVELLVVTLVLSLSLGARRSQADTGTCGGASMTLPFTDVMGSWAFCFIAEVYFTGISLGTSATTFSPANNVTRDQMAVFLSRTLDTSLKRGSRRAALNQWATPDRFPDSAKTTVGPHPRSVQSDGADLWVANNGDGTVSRVRGSDGRWLETWTGAISAYGVLVARGLIYVTGAISPNGQVYKLDPRQPAAAVTTLSSTLGANPAWITTDGRYLWTANAGTTPNTGSVSRIDPDLGTTATFSAGFNQPSGICFDGINVWVSDAGAKTLLKLNQDGTIAQTVTIGNGAKYPLFDGTNIWVLGYTANNDLPGTGFIKVVRAATGEVLATLTPPTLNTPEQIAFDGQRMLVTDRDFLGFTGAVLFKAADLTPLGGFQSFPKPFGVCSDGINFWLTIPDESKLARY